MKKIKEISSPNKEQLRGDLLRIAKRFKVFMILDSNDYPDKYGKYELLAAFGAKRNLSLDHQPFERLKHFLAEEKSWWFGHLRYELKDQIEDLSSAKQQNFQFPLMGFFEPMHLFKWERGKRIGEWWSYAVEELEHCLSDLEVEQNEPELDWPNFRPEINREDYLNRVNALKAEIQYGNIYEVNFCQTFTARSEINPYLTAKQLNEKSPMPFSAFYRLDDDYLICASPERYLCKRGQKLYSQPIKGTAKRSADTQEDWQIQQALKQDLKEQTENVMIVDLVRNDLSRTAARDSVKVEELFGIYSFPQVHQMISTVSSVLAADQDAVDAIKYSFPMGSMTGAPKIKAMQLIEQWEEKSRELYSGSVGYFEPNGDLDLNVVIRSLLYNQKSHLLSYTVGGAITDLATAENEYEECLLKAKAIFELTQSDGHGN